jgi:hypothetical protein
VLGRAGDCSLRDERSQRDHAAVGVGIGWVCNGRAAGVVQASVFSEAMSCDREAQNSIGVIER